LGCAARRRAKRVDVAEPLALGAQLCVVRLTGRKRLDLLDLEREQVEVAVARAGRGAQRVGLRLELERARVASRESGARRRGGVAGEAVEQIERRRRNGQLAVLVLAVEGDEARAEVAQISGRRRAALDERPRPPVRADTAPEDDLSGVVRDPVAD